MEIVLNSILLYGTYAKLPYNNTVQYHCKKITGKSLNYYCWFEYLGVKKHKQKIGPRMGACVLLV